MLSKIEALIFSIATLFVLASFTLTASAQVESVVESSIGLGYIAMAIAIAGSCLGAGFAVANTGAAAIASLTEKPELFARVLIFAGLAEGVAIYGIIIALLIWITLPV